MRCHADWQSNAMQPTKWLYSFAGQWTMHHVKNLTLASSQMKLRTNLHRQVRKLLLLQQPLVPPGCLPTSQTIGAQLIIWKSSKLDRRSFKPLPSVALLIKATPQQTLSSDRLNSTGTRTPCSVIWCMAAVGGCDQKIATTML